ncbi:hypothetical protein PHMEG_00037128 [Phytophthora megakarya]|uniref:Uncharacterized protein n=1 Tax=Phytophthora megakarya TaxID=4795 RepID=A0A225UKK7_9STRA|nr:hypothetical protein PHMEG_00037128 [Phytophthora megakarya]
MDIAAANGHLAVVKWLHFNRPEGCTIAAMNKAASHGHIDVVQWLHSNRTEGCTTKAMDKAASNNHLEVLEWLHANRSEGCTKVAIEEALGSGYLQVVCWLREHYPKLKPTTVDHPIQNPNSFETLLFLHLFYQSLITPRFLENTLEMLGYMDEHTLDTHIRRWLEAKYLD